MTNKNVIELINRLMDTNADKIAYNATEVFTVIAHGYYYIRPGKDTARFLTKINKILENAWRDLNKNQSETKHGVPYDVWLYGKMSAEAISVARSLFDHDYYESQCKNMVMREKYDESLLERYMYWLDEKELRSVFEGILTFKGNYDAFISDENFDKMMEELQECSMVVIQDDPWYMKDYDKHVSYIDNNWDFPFEYITRETIITVVCKYIDDPVVLAHMIKVFKHTDTSTSADYTALALWLTDMFELEIFSPTITDLDKICLENGIEGNSQFIHRNKAGKFMAVKSK